MLELVQTPKIVTFFPLLMLPEVKLLPESKQIPYPLYPYLEVSAFLVNFTALSNPFK